MNGGVFIPWRFFAGSILRILEISNKENTVEECYEMKEILYLEIHMYVQYKQQNQNFKDTFIVMMHTVKFRSSLRKC